MLDSTDRRLIDLLQTDSRMSYAELGKQVGLSVSAVNERVRKLQSRRLLKHYVAIADPEQLGVHVRAFVQVLIDRPENEAAFLACVEEVPEIAECHCITGEYGFLLKVHCRTPEHLEQLLKETIKAAPGVVRTHSLIILSSYKETTALPIYAQEEVGA